MELFFLGTGAGMPSKERNVSALALLLQQERNAVWLFDCGEATQHQILKTKIKPSKIEKIFISHLHGDHIFGLPGLLSSRSFQGGESTIEVYGPSGIKDYLAACLGVSKTHLKYQLVVHEVGAGMIFADEQFSVEAFQLEHGVTSFGYRIVEADRPGALQVEKLKALGVPAGPIYQEIKQGKNIVLANGTVLNSKDFVSAPIKGKVIAIAGDTRNCLSSRKLAQGADWFVHEATFGKDQEDLATEFYHSTNVEAALIAKEAGIRNLILTHISARFIGTDMQQFLQEAREVFPNTFLADDFSSFLL